MLYATCYMMRLNAQQLRELEEKRVSGVIRKVKRNLIYFILENIYDTYNIGGLFRLADAIGVEKMFLCGEMEIPPNSRIKKASIGTYKVVEWEYKKTAKEVITDLHVTCSMKHETLKNSNYQLQNKKMLHIASSMLHVIAVEQNPISVNYTKVDYKFPIALIFGNESYGISEETLKLADQIVEIPMWGINKSLNVIVSAAIVSYWVINKQINKLQINDKMFHSP